MNYLILGNGVAGVKAAETIKRNDSEGRIAMVSEENYPFYYRPQLADYLARKIEENKVWAKPKSFYEERKIDLKLGRRAIKILPAKREVLLDNGERLNYDQLLIATGGKAKWGEWPGSRLEGVVALKSLDEAKKIQGKIKAKGRALIVGEGILAFELIRGLRLAGITVSYLVPGERIWPEMLDESASAIIERRLQAERVEVIKGEEIREVFGSEGRVQAIQTTRGQKIPCELVGVGLGFAPNIDFLKDSGIKTNKGILVDEYLRANMPNIYAAGDVAEVYDPLYGETRVNNGWLNAWEQGEVAGSNMSGLGMGLRKYVGIASTSLRVLGLDLITIGKANPQEKGYEVMRGDYPHPDMPDIYKKLVLQDGKIVGAFFLGNASEAGAARTWIKEEKNISQVEKELLRQLFDVYSLGVYALGVFCPVCKLEIMVERTAREGEIITCPACGVDFKLVRMPSGFFAGERI